MEKLLPPSVWQYSYSSVHRMAALVAKSRKGFLEETGRRTAELLASIALLCDSASFNTRPTDWCCWAAATGVSSDSSEAGVEGAKGDAGGQVAQVGGMQEAFGGCKANKQTN